MLWFDGTVRNAVEKVKSSGVLLLVFVQGEDSLSRKYDSFLSKETKLKPHDYVALKISHNSVALQQFKQIYVSVPVPSLFIIQNNGIPIRVVSSEQTSDVYNAIDECFQKQKKNFPKINQVESNGDVLPEVNKKCFEDPTIKNSQRAQNIGDHVIYIPKDEIKKRSNEFRGFPRFLLIDTPYTCDPSFPSTISRVQSARLQFRLPNNDMPSWEFPDKSTLSDVRAYLSEKMNLSSGFKLLRTYPRTAFTPEDETKTLAELSLTPNATLIVIPVEDKTVPAKMKSLIIRQNFLSTALKTLLQPLCILFGYFKSLLWKVQGENDTKPAKLMSDTSLDKTLNKRTSTSNIHGFKFQEDSDDEEGHPDNGNSTQQKFQK